MTPWLLLPWLFLTAPPQGVDLNVATLNEIRSLPIGYEDAETLSQELGISLDSALQYSIPQAKAESLYAWIQTRGPLTSYFELLKIPTIQPGDLARWRDVIRISKVREGKNFALYVERVRERGASEEAPRESYFDEWIGFLTEPINVNRATVDELYSLYRVSLIDAASVVRFVKVLRLRNVRDLRRVPGLSHYGYLNMRNFLTYRDLKRVPLRGWVHMDAYYSPYLTTAGSNLSERLQQLEATDPYALDSLLQEQGWSESEIQHLHDQLVAEKAYVQALKPEPSFRAKARWSLWGRYKIGFLYQRSPYLGSQTLLKAFVGIDHLGILRRLLIGDYRLTFGQALLMDNTEESRDRILDRPQGLYGDLTSQRSFNLRGVAAQFRWGAFSPTFWYSQAPRHFIPKPDGSPNFYYTGRFIPPTFENRIKETLWGTRMTYDLPQPWFPTGTQIALSYMEIRYPEAIEPDFQALDLPGDRYRLSPQDGSFYWIGGRKKRFIGAEFRWVRAPVSFEWEAAHEFQGGTAWFAKGRVQFDPFYINILFRHYPVNYTNPYMRPFQEDNRFEDTPLEYEYRVLDPLYSELASFPMPKPETGICMETRYQFSDKWLIPRAYVDLWRDNTDGLRNYRIQAEIEYRPVFPLRLRLRQKWQKRRNRRGVEITESLTRETTFRAYVLLTDYDYFGIETRYGSVDLKERLNYPNDEINGGFVAFQFTKTLSDKSEVKAGYIVWRTQGMSQWAFEDTGIDFFYGKGAKFYLAIFHRPTPNLGLKFKVRFKNTIFEHQGLFGQGIHTAEGRTVLGFSEEEPFHSISLSLDYAF